MFDIQLYVLLNASVESIWDFLICLKLVQKLETALEHELFHTLSSLFFWSIDAIMLEKLPIT